MEVKVDIPLYGPSVNIVKKSGDALCKALYDKFRCVTTIQGVEMETEMSNKYQRPPAIIKPERRFEFMMRSGVKVSVWKADLTNFPADAVVNAANEDLKHYGGLALALSTAGGPQIQRESDDYIKKNVKLQTGKAVALGPGSLPYKTIIHAVGPDLSMSAFNFDPEKGRPALEKTIKSILNRVGENRLATVAIPAISSGLFNYPLRECANTIVSTIKAYYDNPHRLTPQEIFLVNNDEPTVQEMERACNQIFSPQQHTLYNQATANHPGSTTKTESLSVQINNVVLTLKKGNIEAQNTDVIVNTASANFKLSTGAISSAISNKAGPEMQNEIKTATRFHNIIHTKPYRLSCKAVYHTVCIEKSNGSKAEKILFDSVSECLWQAAAQNNSSIAFPAIGTGALGFSGAESARLMLDAVTKYALNCSKMLQVHFVIFPTDDRIFQAFESQMKNLQKRPQPNYGHDESQSSRAPAPQISLVCPSEESKHEAERWLKNRLSTDSHSVKINNNFISHFSDHDHLQLAILADGGLSIEEFFSQGHACLTVKGKPEENAVIAALQVEALLCKIHEDFIAEEEHQLKMLTHMKVSGEKKTVDEKSSFFSERIQLFRPVGLWVVKVDKVENDALKEMFDRKKKQLHKSSTKKMFQRIPAQFCEMVSRIGFHAECAPPEDPKYGEGIYFSSSIGTALELWREKGEEYLYFVEAEVLLGNSAKGERGFILPPPVGKDPNILCDSVYGGSDVSVVFSGYQALPKYIITCKKNSR